MAGWGKTIGARAWGLAVAGLACALLSATPSLAQLIPPGLLSRLTSASAAASPAQIEADLLSYDGDSDTISASGNVIMHFMGFTFMGNDLRFNRASNDVRFEGSVLITEPTGMRFSADSFVLTGGMKTAFIQSLTLTMQNGGQVTASDVDYDEALQTVLKDASYSPCGLCVDSKGRTIGWRVKAAKITIDAKTKTTQLEQPVLELLGIPVLWLPYLWLPDPETPILQHLRMPTVDYGDKYGVRLMVPYQMAVNKDTDLIFTPTLLSRQGFLMGAEWIQRVKWGSFKVKVSGVYQADRSVFAHEVGDLDWRGALQSSGRFTPLDGWTMGWSYSAFTDANYLKDYAMPVGSSGINEAYVEHIDDASFASVRVQQFNLLGNVDEGTQEQQGMNLPTARYDSVFKLKDGWGQFDISARLLGVHRELDQGAANGGVYRTQGYAGDKQHLMVQGAWQNQFILPGGFVSSTYLGLRADYANWENGAHSLPPAYPVAPEDQALTSLTPIAAVDLRWPFAIKQGQTVHVVEPIAQLVYRGSDTTLVGITNDNAQSFVFDDTNLFSFNRFSGTDRQETGLRANLGVHYLANFEDGAYIDFLIGQSYHLAGTNAFAVGDQMIQSGSTGLDADASYIVAGVQGAPFEGLNLGGKVQIDPKAGQVTRASLVGNYTFERYALGLTYRYLAADPASGVNVEQQEVGATFALPIDDYWRVTGGAYWDITRDSWLQVSGGVVYDDNYLQFGLSGSVNGPTHASPDAKTIAVSFKLKSPGLFSIGF